MSKRITPIEITELIDILCQKLRTNYVYPEIAEKICQNLRQHQQAGEYEDISDGELLALALTIHLQEVNHDEHLWVRWHADPLPADADQLRNNQQWQEERQLEARLDNFGIYKVDRLPGNIGYLDIQYLHRPEWGREAATAAMGLLANTNALIIDLRKCQGGYPGMVALLCSHLFGAEPQLITSIYWRDEDITQQYWTEPTAPDKRCETQPVFVLISKATFSGGELLAHVLQSRSRATLIGERTDGGAHAGAAYRLAPHFEAFIPIGRTIDPLSSSDWEDHGIIPQIARSSEQALEVAYRMALESVIASLGDPASEPLRQLRDEAQAALDKLEAP